MATTKRTKSAVKLISLGEATLEQLRIVARSAGFDEGPRWQSDFVYGDDLSTKNVKRAKAYLSRLYTHISVDGLFLSGFNANQTRPTK